MSGRSARRRCSRIARSACEVDLHIRVRADDGADVATFDDRVAELGQFALALTHDRAHLRVPGDDGHEPVDPRLTDRGRDIGASDRDATGFVEVDLVLAGKLAELVALRERDPFLHRKPRERAVHRPGVEVAKAEALCEPACDRALSCPGGPVYGNDHRCVTDSRRSKNPGKLTPTASTPSRRTPSREMRPATAPSIASR